MNLILRYLEGRKASTSTALSQELKEVKEQLNSILTKWNWEGATPKNATEFLNKFTPWVNEKIKLGKEVRELLERKGVERLEDIT